MTKDEVLRAIIEYLNDAESISDVMDRHYELRKQVEDVAAENVDAFVEIFQDEAREEAQTEE